MVINGDGIEMMGYQKKNPLTRYDNQMTAGKGNEWQYGMEQKNHKRHMDQATDYNSVIHSQAMDF